MHISLLMDKAPCSLARLPRAHSVLPPSEKPTISCQGRSCVLYLFSIAKPEPPTCPNPSNPLRPRLAAIARPRREARRDKKGPSARRAIVSLLNRGFSVAEIADRNGVSERAMRKSIRTLLARRAPAPPAEFLALQVSRLNEALLVAYGAMSAENLEAVDRVVKIVRELDRYHGFAVQAASAETAPSPAALCPSRARGAGRAVGTNWRRNRLKPFDSRAEMAACRKAEPNVVIASEAWRSRATAAALRSLDRRVAIARRKTGVFRCPTAPRNDDSSRTHLALRGSTCRSPAPPRRCSRAARHAPKGRRGGRRRAGPWPPPRERTARGERPPPAGSRTAPA